jgi:7-carboxy-7-deazaguanine synthase
MQMMYPINEIFETIQGEAAYTGTPSIFIRLQGCPIGCPWCDTKHTWQINEDKLSGIALIQAKDTDSDKYSYATSDAIITLINSYNAKHIVITGGEPCLYDLTELTEAIIKSGRSVQIETSATHEIKCHKDTWVTASPKLNMPGGFELRQDALNRANEIKWPVGKMLDIENLKQVCSELCINIWLQPLSQSPKATKLCIDQAILNGWKISIQTHKYMGIR